MEKISIRLEWSDEARLEYDKMSTDLQEGVLDGVKQLSQRSFSLYQYRPDDIEFISMVSHLQIPSLKIWLELTTQYYGDTKEPILLVYALKESSAANTLKQKISTLEQLKKAHINRAYKMMDADSRTMYPFDLFATAVYKRSMSLIDGFIKMIPENFICAAPLLRLQVDNLLRLYAANRVSVNIHEFAMDVLGGTSIKDMRDKDNPKQKLTDAHLVQKFKHIEPRIESLYKETSGYIHLSEKHIYNSVNITGGAEGKIEAYISEKDQFIKDEERIEAATAMIVITEKLFWLLEGWTFVKNNPEVSKEAWDRGEEFIFTKK